MFTIQYSDEQSNENIKDNPISKSKNLTPQVKSYAQKIHTETSSEIQAKKCLEVAKLLMQADQMTKKLIFRKPYANKK